ncbi:hypothetical protein MPNT_160058 [Candidatus Methylacidithermus pantelleriae]|uniref:Uncharacterized protein n=1 Tax=Candidatus Methylacidithermus pantelleriae TaxID=2744239 RepID=A0A8J2BLW1_9BACT|nr:hypothetical protein MPNT_160058 [Candidatus Methylacidithermus pantelleriae]
MFELGTQSQPWETGAGIRVRFYHAWGRGPIGAGLNSFSGFSAVIDHILPLVFLVVPNTETLPRATGTRYPGDLTHIGGCFPGSAWRFHCPCGPARHLHAMRSRGFYVLR